MRTFLAGVALCAIAAGQARVEGRVVSTTGEPVRKATVRLSVGGQPNTIYVETSGPDGRFLFENVVPGRYTASAQRPGYSLAGSPPAAFMLAGGETKRDLEIQMTPMAVVSGTVTDLDGDPVAGVQVQIMRRAWTQGRMRLQPAVSINTDDRGQFRSISLIPGRYFVLATDPASRQIGTNPNEIRGRSALEANLPTFHPGSADSRGAILVDARGGAEASNVNIRMRRGRTYSARGVVVDENGAGAQVQVMLYQKSEEGAAANTSVAARPGTGIFEFRGLTPGDYTLVARSTQQRGDTVAVRLPAGGAPPPPPPPPSATLTGRLDFSVGGADVEGLSIRVTPGGEIKGRVKLDGDGDLGVFLQTASVNAPRAVRASPDGMSTAVTQGGPAQPMPSVVLSSEEGTSTRSSVAADGTFRAVNLASSKYVVSIAPLTPGAYIKSVRWGSQDIGNALLDLTAGTAGSLEIVVSAKGAQINGVIEPGTAVTVWPAVRVATDPQGGVRNLRSSAQGTFTLNGLAPGEYYVAAWEEVSQDLSRIPDFLDLFRSAAVKVKVAEGESVSPEPKLISRETTEKAVEQFR